MNYRISVVLLVHEGMVGACMHGVALKACVCAKCELLKIKCIIKRLFDAKMKTLSVIIKLNLICTNLHCHSLKSHWCLC